MKRKGRHLLTFLNNNYLYLCFTFTLTIIAYSISTISPASPQTNFVDLAYAFLNGKLHLLEPVRVWNDYALYNGKYYIYFGPVPALLLMPFVLLFGINFPQQFLMPISSILIFFAILRICHNIGTSIQTAWWMAIFFVFGTIYLFLGITTISAYNTQVITVLFIFFALWEFTGRKRWWLIGLFIALSGMTRPTGYLSVSFFLVYLLLSSHYNLAEKIRHSLLMITIIIGSILVIGLYNYARFESFTQTGYKYESTFDKAYTTAKSYGTISFTHLPGNVYTFLLKGPDPIRADSDSYVLRFPYLRVSEWGMGILFTSPVLIYLINIKRKSNLLIIPSVIAVIAALIIPLLYYSIGLWQYGYRYALEAYPFFILLLASVFTQKVPLPAKLLIIYGIIFNLAFMYSIWYIYPFPT